MKRRWIRTSWRAAVVCAAFIICCEDVGAQWTIAEPVEQTAFRKGRWITGLAGSINSGVTRLGSTDRGSTNGYVMELSAGNFLADRWTAGAIFQAGRTSNKRLVQSDSESLFIGPTTSYYFMKSSNGSVYLSIAMGYLRFREETTLERLNLNVRESLEGQGFGILTGLAYAFVVNDDIVFDIGLNFASSWLSGDRVSEPNGVIAKEDFYAGSIRFVFGFRVIL